LLFVFSVDCGSNAISNVKLRGAQVALSFAAGDVHLQNVEVSNSLTVLSVAFNASLQLSDCRFHDNRVVLESVRDIWHINVSSCVFMRNQKPLRLREVRYVGVEDSRFSDNTQSSYIWAYRYPVALSVKRSRFDNDEVTITARRNAHLSASVEDCIFNSSALTLVVQGYRRSSILVDKSTFNASRITASLASQGLNLSIVASSFRRMVNRYRGAVEVTASYLSSAQSVVITDNVFEQNSGAPCIRFDLLSVSSNVKPGGISIVGNRFTNHSGSNVIVINDRAYYHVQLRRNAFQNPLCPYEIEVQSSWKSGYAINSSENWWGSANRTYVAGRVSDFFADSKKAEVSITSVYADPELTQLEIFPELRTWNVIGGKLVGGQLDRNVTLTSSSAPYLVSKTIYIPKGFYLHVEENVTLHFAENRGVVVEGKSI